MARFSAKPVAEVRRAADVVVSRVGYGLSEKLSGFTRETVGLDRSEFDASITMRVGIDQAGEIDDARLIWTGSIGEHPGFQEPIVLPVIALRA